MRKILWQAAVLSVLILLLGISGAVCAKEASSLPSYNGHSGNAIGDASINPKDGAPMVWVPAGEFLMGSSDEETDALLKENPHWRAEWFSDEKPQREVYLDGYWVYKHEVTVAEYKKFCHATGREMPLRPSHGWKDNDPIVNVAWQDAVDYAKWAGTKLPTEAQWEKAARGTDGRTYPWGNVWDATKCANSVEKKLQEAQPVGSYPAGASPYGCMDMAGNVWEWCADLYDQAYYATAPLKNPKGPAAVKDEDAMNPRVVRGGSWYRGSRATLRCADRNHVPAVDWNYNYGFRCVATPQ